MGGHEQELAMPRINSSTFAETNDAYYILPRYVDEPTYTLWLQRNGDWRIEKSVGRYYEDSTSLSQIMHREARGWPGLQ